MYRTLQIMGYTAYQLVIAEFLSSTVAPATLRLQDEIPLGKTSVLCPLLHHLSFLAVSFPEKPFHLTLLLGWLNSTSYETGRLIYCQLGDYMVPIPPIKKGSRKLHWGEPDFWTINSMGGFQNATRQNWRLFHYRVTSSDHSHLVHDVLNNVRHSVIIPGSRFRKNPKQNPYDYIPTGEKWPHSRENVGIPYMDPMGNLHQDGSFPQGIRRTDVILEMWNLGKSEYFNMSCAVSNIKSLQLPLYTTSATSLLLAPALLVEGCKNHLKKILQPNEHCSKRFWHDMNHKILIGSWQYPYSWRSNP